MAKRTTRKKSLSGTVKIVKPDPAPYFGYEVDLYKLYKDRAELVKTKLYSSPVKLNIKKETFYKRISKECLLMKCIDLLYAPLDYINENFPD